MKLIIEIILLFFALYIGTAIVFWTFNLRINTTHNIKAREWLKNFPTLSDPDKWDRLKKDRQIDR